MVGADELFIDSCAYWASQGKPGPNNGGVPKRHGPQGFFIIRRRLWLSHLVALTLPLPLPLPSLPAGSFCTPLFAVSVLLVLLLAPQDPQLNAHFNTPVRNWCDMVWCDATRGPGRPLLPPLVPLLPPLLLQSCLGSWVGLSGGALALWRDV